MDKHSAAGFGIFTILNGLDYYLTKRILKSGGKELNPIVDVIGLVPTKAIAITSAGVMACFGCKIFVPLNIVMAGVCTWNYIQVKKIQKLKKSSK